MHFAEFESSGSYLISLSEDCMMSECSLQPASTATVTVASVTVSELDDKDALLEPDFSSASTAFAAAETDLAARGFTATEPFGTSVGARGCDLDAGSAADSAGKDARVAIEDVAA